MIHTTPETPPRGLQIKAGPSPWHIVVANSKGGSGKTTVATNLAAFFANQQRVTVLVDHDVQASATHWLQLRPAQAAPITGIEAYAQSGAQMTRSFQNRLPRDAQRVVVDTPAGLCGDKLYNLVADADLIVVPIIPSPIDIHAAEHFINEIHLAGCMQDEPRQILVVANRVRKNTVMFAQLNEFLVDLHLPRVTYIRDTQLYNRAIEKGLGMADIHSSSAQRERNHWLRIGSWIENRFAIRGHGQNSALARQADFMARV